MICAYSSCDTQPIVRLKLPTGWALFCRKHYDAHAQQQADNFCLKNGLDTTAKKMAFCREKLETRRPAGNWWANEVMSKVAAGEHVGMAAYEMAKAALRPAVEREPGQDDEELAA